MSLRSDSSHSDCQQTPQPQADREPAASAVNAVVALDHEHTSQPQVTVTSQPQVTVARESATTQLHRSLSRAGGAPASSVARRSAALQVSVREGLLECCPGGPGPGELLGLRAGRERLQACSILLTDGCRSARHPSRKHQPRAVLQEGGRGGNKR